MEYNFISGIMTLTQFQCNRYKGSIDMDIFIKNNTNTETLNKILVSIPQAVKNFIAEEVFVFFM